LIVKDVLKLEGEHDFYVCDSIGWRFGSSLEASD